MARDPLQPLQPGELRIGRLMTGHDLVLPAFQVLRHIAIFGPPGSGKSKTFTMNCLRDWARTGSAIVLDPKGELFEQTANEYRNVFRLDLQDPMLSDRWNFVPDCYENAEFAHLCANIMIGWDETSHQTGDDTSRFFMVSEIAALTSILLHLPRIAKDPVPAHINEFIAARSIDPPEEGDPSPLNEEMSRSLDKDARVYWGTFAKSKRDVQGSILTGLAVKCAQFTVPHAKAISTPLTDAERRAGKIKEIDLRLLREPGTAIYVAVPEGDASRYATLLSLFFGLACAQLRQTRVDDETAPVLFAFDEAGNIPIHGLKEMLGVGRGRKVSILLDYQNLPQVHAQYGVNKGNASLGSVGTMIFLPGLDKETAKYASERIGKTTVLQHTSVDGPGKRHDNEREAETKRDLVDPAEIRQLVRHKQAIAVIDTLPPIKMRYPPIDIHANPVQAVYKGLRMPSDLDVSELEFKRAINSTSDGAKDKGREEANSQPATDSAQATKPESAKVKPVRKAKGGKKKKEKKVESEQVGANETAHESKSDAGQESIDESRQVQSEGGESTAQAEEQVKSSQTESVADNLTPDERGRLDEPTGSTDNADALPAEEAKGEAVLNQAEESAETMIDSSAQSQPDDGAAIEEKSGEPVSSDHENRASGDKESIGDAGAEDY